MLSGQSDEALHIIATRPFSCSSKALCAKRPTSDSGTFGVLLGLHLHVKPTGPPSGSNLWVLHVDAKGQLFSTLHARTKLVSGSSLWHPLGQKQYTDMMEQFEASCTASQSDAGFRSPSLQSSALACPVSRERERERENSQASVHFYLLPKCSRPTPN